MVPTYRTKRNDDVCLKHEQCKDNIFRIRNDKKLQKKKKTQDFGSKILTKDKFAYMGNRGSFR